MSFQEFLQAKKNNLSSRQRKGLVCRPNGRSTDFIAPNLATGCELACSYCYVARHREYGNPLEQYTNFSEITKSVLDHYNSLGAKDGNQCDPDFWTYDIGESTDCLSPKNIEGTRKYIKFFLENTNAKPCFATKLSSGRNLHTLAKPRMARVRVSLMPQVVASQVEKATSTIDKRIQSIQELYDLGYEVHINFSPVIVYKGWRDDYAKLCGQIDSCISDDVKRQLKCEVIFLTHHAGLHDSNLRWIPEAEGLMWKPEWQEYKTTERGDSSVLRYQYQIKNRLVELFKEVIANHLSYCKIRYIF
jgi:DNA repair photolyase